MDKVLYSAWVTVDLASAQNGRENEQPVSGFGTEGKRRLSLMEIAQAGFLISFKTRSDADVKFRSLQ